MVVRNDVPIFVLTHQPPKRQPRENNRVFFTFVTEGIEKAVALAKAAAGEKDVTIIAATSTTRQCLEAGLAGELHIDIMPVMLCAGLRLFEGLNVESIRMERLKVASLPGGRTNMQFRIVK
jgi:dihydrofolate reductase